MKGRHYTINAEVLVQPVFNEPATPVSEPLLFTLGGKTVGEIAQGDLRSVTVVNSIDRPYATFRLEFAPRQVVRNQTWADLIKPYSLVTIALQRRGEASDPATTSAPEPICLGLVDAPEIGEDFAGAAPVRTVRVTGRSLSALLADHRWWFHHFAIDERGQPRTNLPDISDLLSFTEVPTLKERQQQREAFLAELGILAVDLNLYDPTERDLPSLLKRSYEFFVGKSDGDPGFIKVQFADGRPLRERLVLDAGAVRQNVFDPGIWLLQQFLPTQQFASMSCWDLLNHFVEQPFGELFSDTFGATLGEAFVEVIARKPPWLGHIVHKEGVGAAVGFSTGARAGRGESLFDGSYGTWDRHVDTVEIDGTDIIARPLLRRSVEGQGRVYTLYNVQPRIMAQAGNSHSPVDFQRIIPFLPDTDPFSPANIRRYGVRPLSVTTKYVSIFEHDGSTRRGDADIVRQAVAYAALLREWYHRAPEFWSGTYVLKGRTSLRAGRRLVDLDLNREYYITSVAHRMQLDGTEPHYTTTVQVERGWDLA